MKFMTKQHPLHFANLFVSYLKTYLCVRLTFCKNTDDHGSCQDHNGSVQARGVSSPVFTEPSADASAASAAAFVSDSLVSAPAPWVSSSSPSSQPSSVGSSTVVSGSETGVSVSSGTVVSGSVGAVVSGSVTGVVSGSVGAVVSGSVSAGATERSEPAFHLRHLPYKFPCRALLQRSSSWHPTESRLCCLPSVNT